MVALLGEDVDKETVTTPEINKRLSFIKLELILLMLPQEYKIPGTKE